MRRLPKPTVDTSAHFQVCAGATRDPGVRARLFASSSAILGAVANYESAGTSGNLCSLGPIVTTATADELRRLYERSMQRRDGVGRPVYDQLLLAPSNGICPLCAQRTVATLDHYLPRAAFPEFSIVPINLVPACRDCNRAKHVFSPSSAGDQIIHPYFDVLDEGLWLKARMHRDGMAPTLTFFADAPATWNSILRERVAKQFELLALGDLYAAHAAEEMTNIVYRLRSLLAAGGADEVRRHLVEEAESRAAAAPNSWQAVTYRTLAADGKYCDGEFDV